MLDSSALGTIVAEEAGFRLKLVEEITGQQGDVDYELETTELADGRIALSVQVDSQALRKSVIEVDYSVGDYTLWEGEHGAWPLASGAVEYDTELVEPGRFRYLARLTGDGTSSGATGEFELMRLVFEPTPSEVAFLAPQAAAETATITPQVNTLLSFPQAQFSNWPSDPVQQAWLTNWYLDLPPLTGPSSIYSDPEWQRRADEVFTLTNQARADKKHTPLVRDPHLDAVAQAMARHMAEEGFFDHENPQGLDVFERLEAAHCAEWWTAGENIAAGYANPQAVHKGWMDSSGHRKNIRNEQYRAVGIGVYHAPGTQLGWYWVQVFATFKDNAIDHIWIEPGV